MRFATKGYLGANDKNIHVYTNDPRNPQINLRLTGTVKQFVSLTPNRVILRGNGSGPIRETVTIIPSSEVALNIVQVTPSNGSDFDYSLEEVIMFGHKTYQVTVKNLKKSRGRYTGKLTFSSDNSAYPEFSIMISGDIQ